MSKARPTCRTLLLFDYTKRKSVSVTFTVLRSILGQKERVCMWERRGEEVIACERLCKNVGTKHIC